ncbi:DUF2092 domain-containing protein [Geminocystis herdmanii]|uniref:DUF2092 domain-containing protein n=1 Tax=Geminocystis herdmanii TaxID=669359 RepID=UPI000346AA1B|nr:DUF2092 domain-containing protein [Geminocystis herdmanii]
MNYSKILLTLAFCVTSTFGVASKIQAQNVPNTETSPITTDELLNQVCDFLKSQQSFSVEMDVTYDNVLASGSKVQYSGYKQVSLQRPNLLRVDTIGDQEKRSFYYDGKSFTLFSPLLNVFATKEAPTTIDDMVSSIEQNYGFTIAMSNLFTSNPCRVLDDIIEEPLYIGSNLVNRVETDHLLLVTDDWDGQLWISQDNPPLIKKAIITYKNLPNAPQYTVLFSNWNFKPSFSQDIFTFTPKKDNVRIEILPPSP